MGEEENCSSAMHKGLPASFTVHVSLEIPLGFTGGEGVLMCSAEHRRPGMLQKALCERVLLVFFTHTLLTAQLCCLRLSSVRSIPELGAEGTELASVE